MAVEFTTYLGVPISVDTDGTFSAKPNGLYVQDKVLTKVKKAIRDAAVTVPLLMERSHYQYGEVMDVALVAAIQGDFAVLPPSGRKYTTERLPLARFYEMNPAYAAQVEAIEREYREANERATATFQAGLADAKTMLVPITRERFAELLEAERAKRQGGE